MDNQKQLELIRHKKIELNSILIDLAKDTNLVGKAIKVNQELDILLKNLK